MAYIASICILSGGYKIKNKAECVYKNSMKSRNLENAMRECLQKPRCDAFVDVCGRNDFHLCADTLNKEPIESVCRSTLYIKGAMK